MNLGVKYVSSFRTYIMKYSYICKPNRRNGADNAWGVLVYSFEH